MKPLRIVFRVPALREVDAYFGYLVREASIDVATRFARSVFETAESLAEFPLRGRQVPHLWAVRMKLRVWPVRDFEAVHIYYRVNRSSVEVMRIIDARRDLRRSPAI